MSDVLYVMFVIGNHKNVCKKTYVKSVCNLEHTEGSVWGLIRWMLGEHEGTRITVAGRKRRIREGKEAGGKSEGSRVLASLIGRERIDRSRCTHGKKRGKYSPME